MFGINDFTTSINSLMIYFGKLNTLIGVRVKLTTDSVLGPKYTTGIFRRFLVGDN